MAALGLMSITTGDVDCLMPGSREECSEFPWKCTH